MPNLFARQTSLTDVAGRIDYIGNPLRQEHLLSTYDTASDLLDGRYWQILARESHASFDQYGTEKRMVRSKTGELIEQTLQCCEAREVFFLLGNELLQKKSPQEILKEACEAVSQKVGRPVTGALHLNKTTKSLHVHIIYAERELLQEPVVKVAERNLFFDAEGKRRYKKSEILDEEGQLLPGCRIVQKGEVYESRCFGSVDKHLLEKEWLKDLKTDCILQLRNGALKGDVEITEYDPSTGMLPQRYIGNKVPEDVAAEMAAENALVREYNAAVQAGLLSHEEAMMVQREVNRSADKKAELEWYLEQIREREPDEPIQTPSRKDSLMSMMGAAERKLPTGQYWQQYREIRDATWEAFIQGQRTEFKAIRSCKEDLQNLRFQNSHVVLGKNGEIVGHKLNSPAKLQKAGYFDARDEIKQDLNEHKSVLAFQRKYQEVAKGRQKIVRALLLAGAEKDVIDVAMREYEAAMKLLQNYAEDPLYDMENRRLKAAQTSLALAQGRAKRYIEKLEAEKLKEESALEIQAEQEYQDFKKDGTIADDEVGSSQRDVPRRGEPLRQVEAER